MRQIIFPLGRLPDVIVVVDQLSFSRYECTIFFQNEEIWEVDDTIFAYSITAFSMTDVYDVLLNIIEPAYEQWYQAEGLSIYQLQEQ